MKNHYKLRLFTSLAIWLNILFNFLYDILPIDGYTIIEINRLYPALISPPEFTQVIRYVILLSFLFYSVYQLMPQANDQHVFEAINPLFLVNNILHIVWVYMFTTNHVIAGMLVIVAMLLCSMHLFRIAKGAMQTRHYSPFILIPFSLYAGWLTVANIANFAVVLSYGGYLIELTLETYFTAILVVIAGLTAIAVSVKYGDWLYPLVIAWFLAGVWFKNRVPHPSLASVTGLAALFVFLWSAGFLIRRLTRRPIEETYN